jgi:predicted metal-dependent peptidase
MNKKEQSNLKSLLRHGLVPFMEEVIKSEKELAKEIGSDAIIRQYIPLMEKFLYDLSLVRMEHILKQFGKLSEKERLGVKHAIEHG